MSTQRFGAAGRRGRRRRRRRGGGEQAFVVAAIELLPERFPAASYASIAERVARSARRGPRTRSSSRCRSPRASRRGSSRSRRRRRCPTTPPRTPTTDVCDTAPRVRLPGDDGACVSAAGVHALVAGRPRRLRQVGRVAGGVESLEPDRVRRAAGEARVGVARPGRRSDLRAVEVQRVAGDADVVASLRSRTS